MGTVGDAEFLAGELWAEIVATDVLHMAATETELSLRQPSWIPVVLTRWVWVIGISYALLYGMGGLAPVWPNQVLVGALLLSNVTLWLLLRGGADWKKLRLGFTVADIFVVTLIVRILGADRAELYVVYFAVLLLATVVPNLVPVAGLTIVGAVAYGTVMYFQVGPAMFRDPGAMVRLPFLLGIALYFGSIVQEARNEQARADKVELEARQIAERAKHLAEEQYRLQALSEIGRLGLSGVRSDPGEVLFNIIQRVQKVVGVNRCSLVIFERDGAPAYVAASGDDMGVEVRVIRLEEYPELRVSLQSGEITELYPGEPADLWKKVQEHLPPANPFRSFLIVPIQRGNRLMGAIYLHTYGMRTRTGDTRKTIGTSAPPPP